MRAIKYIIIFWANWRRRLGALRQEWFARGEGCNLYPPSCAIQVFPGKMNRIPVLHSFIKLMPLSSFPLKAGLNYFSLKLEAILVWKPP